MPEERTTLLIKQVSVKTDSDHYFFSFLNSCRIEVYSVISAISVVISQSITQLKNKSVLEGNGIHTKQKLWNKNTISIAKLRN